MELRLFNYETKEVITTINVRKNSSNKTIHKKLDEVLKEVTGNGRSFYQGVLGGELWLVTAAGATILEEPGNYNYERWNVNGPGATYYEFKRDAEERDRKKEEALNATYKYVDSDTVKRLVDIGYSKADFDEVDNAIENNEIEYTLIEVIYGKETKRIISYEDVKEMVNPVSLVDNLRDCIRYSKFGKPQKSRININTTIEYMKVA